MMKTLLMLILSAGFLHAGPPPFNWKEVKIGKVGYVGLDQVKRFYSLGPMKTDGKEIALENNRVSMEFTGGSQAMRMNGVKIFLSEPVRKHDGMFCISSMDLASVVDPLLRPARLQQARPFDVVVLDAGHGGKDKGAGGKEAALTLSLAKQTRGMLEKRGYQVVMTRSDDAGVTLAKRVEIANAQENAVVVSLHFNSGPKRVSGFETHVLSARAPNKWGKLGMALGVAVHSRSMLALNSAKGHDFKIPDRGIRHSKYRLLVGCKHPTVMLEAGFLSHPEEAAKIEQVAYQKALAAGIVRGVDVFRSAQRKR